MCWRCETPLKAMTGQCPNCGVPAPDALVASWDWRAQPDWERINELLAPLGCKIEMLDAGDDSFHVTATVMPPDDKLGHSAPAEDSDNTKNI